MSAFVDIFGFSDLAGKSIGLCFFIENVYEQLYSGVGNRCMYWKLATTKVTRGPNREKSVGNSKLVEIANAILTKRLRLVCSLNMQLSKWIEFIVCNNL